MNVTKVKAPLPGPQGKILLEKWHRFEADVVGFQAPVVWDHARGCVVTDVDGNTYLDWTCGAQHFGRGFAEPCGARQIQSLLSWK